jgi:hypothetical protein
VDKSVYKKPYEPMMLTQTKYGPVDGYGIKFFRQEASERELPNGVRYFFFILFFY